MFKSLSEFFSVEWCQCWKLTFGTPVVHKQKNMSALNTSAELRRAWGSTRCSRCKCSSEVPPKGIAEKLVPSRHRQEDTFKPMKTVHLVPGEHNSPNKHLSTLWVRLWNGGIHSMATCNEHLLQSSPRKKKKKQKTMLCFLCAGGEDFRNGLPELPVVSFRASNSTVVSILV